METLELETEVTVRIALRLRVTADGLTVEGVTVRGCSPLGPEAVEHIEAALRAAGLH